MTDVAIINIDPQTSLLAPGNIALGVIGVLGLLGCRSIVAQTTLLAAWYWALFSLSAVVIVEVALSAASMAPPNWAAHARYAAAITTLAPQMAVLGAKRPQHRAWQFVVLSLLVILLLPAAGSLLRPGASAILEGPWRWFLLLLVLVGWVNHAATRYGPSCLLLALGQCSLLAAHLPLPVPEMGRSGQAVGLALGVAAVVLVALGVPRSRPRGQPLDRLWFDFRDLFGMLWSLRLAERFNASARMYDWPLRLTWRGIHSTVPAAELAPDVEAAVRRNLSTLLRRFVSPEWIAESLPPDNDSDRHASSETP